MIPKPYSFVFYPLGFVLFIIMFAIFFTHPWISLIILVILVVMVMIEQQTVKRINEQTTREHELKRAKKSLSSAETQQLITQLGDTNSAQQQIARYTLINSNADLSLLLEALHSPDKHLRIEAAATMGYIVDDRIEPELLAMLSDADREVAKAALDALITLQSSIRQQIYNERFESIREQQKSIADISKTDGREPANQRSLMKSAILSLMKIIFDQPADTALYNRAFDLLNHYSDEAAFNLFISLADATNPYKAHAVSGLTLLKDPRSTDALINLMKQSAHDSTLFLNLVGALGSIEDARAFEAALTALKHPEPHMRGQVMMTLALTEDTRFIEPFKALFKDKAIAIPAADRDPAQSVGDLAHFYVKELQNKSRNRA